MNFRAVLALPKTAGSAQTHKSMSFIWIGVLGIYNFGSVSKITKFMCIDSVRL